MAEDLDQVWNNPNGPEFTLCFQITALVWVPCGFLWFLLMSYAHYLSQLKSQSFPRSKLNQLKIFFASLLCLITLTDTLKGGMDYHIGDRPMAYVVCPGILSFTLLVVLVLICVEHCKALLTSAVLFLFHLLLLLVGVVPLYMKLLKPDTQGWYHDKFRYITFFAYYLCTFIQFILFCFAEPFPVESASPDREPSPELRSSFLSRLTFWWLNGLLWKGYQKPLQHRNIWAVNPQNMACNIYPGFERVWKQEQAKTQSGLHQDGVMRRVSKEYNEQLKQESQTDRNESCKIPSEEDDSHERNSLSGHSDDTATSTYVPKKISASLLKTLIKVFGPDLLKANLFSLIGIAARFAGPVLQSALIEYAQSDTPQWKGFFFAGLFFIQNILATLFFHLPMFYCEKTVTNIYACLCAAIYRKVLTMTNASRKNCTAGEITNLVSVDTIRLHEALIALTVDWTAPVQILFGIYMLWSLLGASVLPGVGVLILLVVLNALMVKVMRQTKGIQLKQRDCRIKLLTEILNGIKMLKLYAWEMSFKEKIDTVRNLELKYLLKASNFEGWGRLSWQCTPVLVVSTTFVAFVLSGHSLDAQKVFVSLSIFEIIGTQMNVLPYLINSLAFASVSYKRLSEFLQTPDIDAKNIKHDQKAAYPLTIKEGTFAWGTEKYDTPILKNINLQVPDGQLVAVVGQVGCGKSSLISAFLGEMEKLSGHVSVRGSIAYVAQQAWIQNQTLRDNILFGKEYHSATYNEVLEACALKPDLEILPAGDQTEIGEKGINLSGGQKQRVSLARAVYNDADIYFLDDPLSAVDSHVGKHIFEKVVGPNGLLQNTTRVLVTHGVQWLPNVDKIVVLVNGEISEMGSYEELLSHDGPFAQFLKTYLTQEDSESEDECEEVREEKHKILQRVSSIKSDDEVMKNSLVREKDSGSEIRHRKRTISPMSSMDKHKNLQGNRTSITDDPAFKKQRLIEDEKINVGAVNYRVLLHYIQASGTASVFCWILFFAGFKALSVMSDMWLSKWTEDITLNNEAAENSSEFTEQKNMYLAVYVVIGVTQDYVEYQLPNAMFGFIERSLSLVGVVIVIVYSTPAFLSVIVPVGILYYHIQEVYSASSGQIRRLLTASKSPLYVHFSETLAGTSTIRAFNKQQLCTEILEQKLDHNFLFVYLYYATLRWLNVTLDIIGSVLIFSTVLFLVVGKENGIPAGVVGLAISYALQVKVSIAIMVRIFCGLKVALLAVENIQEYTELEQEAELYNSHTKPHDSWPDEGKLVLNEYSTRYRPGLDLVLRDISFKVNAGEKVGIVGRTGAGKSSLTLSLFRLIEAAEGRILIDGIPLDSLGLHHLRSRITILPQDPVLFSGTLRMNLDPFDKYTDDEIWFALEHAHLNDFVTNQAHGLNHECGEGGQNLSVGQRQLVCLARTLLRKTKILVLDEATAAVDLETDDLIQNTIRQEFKECTVLTIAHRLNTIMDNDRILVLDRGSIAEFDTPSNLLSREDSVFYGMAKDAGLV